jgi:hypothetical protein
MSQKSKPNDRPGRLSGIVSHLVCCSIESNMTQRAAKLDRKQLLFDCVMDSSSQGWSGCGQGLSVWWLQMVKIDQQVSCFTMVPKQDLFDAWSVRRDAEVRFKDERCTRTLQQPPS